MKETYRITHWRPLLNGEVMRDSFEFVAPSAMAAIVHYREWRRKKRKEAADWLDLPKLERIALVQSH